MLFSGTSIYRQRRGNASSRREIRGIISINPQDQAVLISFRLPGTPVTFVWLVLLYKKFTQVMIKSIRRICLSILLIHLIYLLMCIFVLSFSRIFGLIRNSRHIVFLISPFTSSSCQHYLVLLYTKYISNFLHLCLT